MAKTRFKSAYDLAVATRTVIVNDGDCRRAFPLYGSAMQAYGAGQALGERDGFSETKAAVSRATAAMQRCVRIVDGQFSGSRGARKRR